jgi:hypothetical protein
MSWKSYLTSQLQLIMWTEGSNTTHQNFINRLNSTKYLNLCFNYVSFFSFVFLSLFSFFYSYIINTIITIHLSPFLSSSLSLLLLYGNPLFFLPITLLAPSHPISLLSSSSPPILLQPLSTLPLPPTHSPLLTTLLYQMHTTPAPINP